MRDYRQRCSTRSDAVAAAVAVRSLLHLPLPKLWDMKTGGILSRLTGDVDTTTGLLQGAIVSPTLSFIGCSSRSASW
jgi:ATP-binding cassette subfamily B protein/subfamily B ATP-binding cassette protein MsbA